MSIPGLYYQDDIINKDYEMDIIRWIDEQPWNNSLKRRTQHYGYEYNYSSRSAAKPTTPLNGHILQIADWLSKHNIMQPQQCIINEYLKNQGIAAHIDAKSFGPTIVSISLNEPCNMLMTKGNQEIKLTLMPRSILILSGEARTQWKHEINPVGAVLMNDGSTYIKPDN